MFCHQNHVWDRTHQSRKVPVVTSLHDQADTLSSIRRRHHGAHCSDTWPTIRLGTAQSRYQFNQRRERAPEDQQKSSTRLARGDRTFTCGSKLTTEITIRYNWLTYAQAVNLSLPQQFEAESIKRSIDDTDDLDTLKALARELADLYVRQRAATAWVIAEK